MTSRATARAWGLLLGVAADAALGDPRRAHPVAAFGAAAQAAERAWWADSRWRGALHVAACLLPLGVAGAAVEHLAGGDVAAARERLPALCGRDPRSLDAPELARAAIESVAENTSDAVVAPLLWGAVGGVPALLAYRAVNTLDAMVGHRSPRYRRFGEPAARLDDVANYLPARLTAVSIAVAAPLVGGSLASAVRAWWRDARRHPSPNAGPVEAAAAGALGVRLGGINRYGDRVEVRGPLGDGNAPVPGDIPRAVRLCVAAAFLAGGLCVVAAGRTGRGWRR